MGTRFQTVAAMACMKSCLMVFNLAFWTSGLIILCAGIWMQVELHRYLELSTSYNNLIPLVLMLISATILLVATAACCCTVKGQPSLLYFYGFFLAVILILELIMAVAIYAYKDDFTDGFTRGLNDTMVNYGTKDAVKSAEFDSMQAKLHCCGSNDYKDWNKLNPPRPVPRSCCIKEGCDVQDETQIYQQGCYAKVISFLDSNMAVIGGLALALTFFPLLGTILSCCLAANINKAKYEQMT